MLPYISKYVIKFARFLQVLMARFISDGCGYQAAALTYTSLLSLVPLMTVSLAIFSAFPGFKALSGQIVNFIFQHYVVTSGTLVQTYLQKFIAQAPKLSAIGVTFLIITAVLMMFNMERAFNAIWHVNLRRNGLSAFILYWAILTLAPVLLGISFVLSSYLMTLPFITAIVTYTPVMKLGLSLLPFVLTASAFTLFYIAIPNCPVPFRAGIIAALIATMLFELAKFGFGFYIRHFTFYALLYGALAVVPIFLIWLYISWVIILFGAVLSNVLAVGHGYRSEEKLDGFSQAFRWLGYFWMAWQDGKSLSLHELVELDDTDYQIAPERQLELLLGAGLIQPVSTGKYILSKNLTSFTLKDLLYALPWRLPRPEQLAIHQSLWDQSLAKIIASATVDLDKKLAVPLAEIYTPAKS